MKLLSRTRMSARPRGRVIDHDVAAALGAIPAVAQLAGVELTEKLLAFTDFHRVGFPQRKDADRRGAITPALVAMTVAHVQRLTGRFDFHRPAITPPICVSGIESNSREPFCGRSQWAARLC